MKRRITAILIALSFLFCSLPAMSSDMDDDEDFEFEDEESGYEEKEDNFKTIAGYDTGEKIVVGDFTYQALTEGNDYKLIGYTGASKDVVVPENVDGHAVVVVFDHAFYYNNLIETVQIPDCVQLIGSMAFAYCENLKSVNIPEGIKTIEQACFLGCNSLKNITIPDSLEEICNCGFAACGSLTEITFGPNLAKVGPAAFQLCASLEKVTLPETATVEPTSFIACSENLEIIRR